MHAHQVPHTERVEMVRLEALARQRRAVLRLAVHGSASKVMRSGDDAQVVSCHRYLVVFHPFVEQLTVHLDTFWCPSSILRVLNLDLHAMRHRAICNGIMSGTCQKVRKLFISTYISILNPLHTYIHTHIHTYIHTYIQAQPQTKTPLAPAAPA